jgi:hypothetical protein
LILRRAIFAVVLAASALPAQVIEAKVTRAKQVIDEAVAALGGDKFLTMHDRTEIGRVYSFYRDQLTGLSRARIYTRYVRRPDPFPTEPLIFQRERQSFGKDKEEYAILFDEKEGWQISFRGARPVMKETLTRYQDSTRRNIFYILRQRLGEPGLTMESKGREIFENQSVELVEFFDTGNTSVIVYFSSTTKLPIRQVFYRRDPVSKEKHEEVTLFSKFRASSGVMWPWAITRTRDGGKVYEIFSESVLINQDLDDQKFLLPSGTKVLPESR